MNIPIGIAAAAGYVLFLHEDVPAKRQDRAQHGGAGRSRTRAGGSSVIAAIFCCRLAQPHAPDGSGCPRGWRHTCRGLLHGELRHIRRRTGAGHGDGAAYELENASSAERRA
jgi:hypothetical protein